MADFQATYAIVAEDEVSGAATSAAKALEKLDKQIASDTKALAAMQKAMKDLQGGTSVNVEQYKKLQATIDKQKQSIAEARAKVLDLGGGFKKTGGSSNSLESKLKLLAEKTKGLPGPIGGVVNTLQTLRGLVAGNAIAIGIGAIGVAMAALVVTALAATRSLYQYGVAQADARRSELLRLEGLTKMRFLFQRMPGNAKEMQAAIDQVAAKTPIAREQVAKYSEQLYRMGLRGSALTKTLEGVAIKSAVQGEEAANAFAGWAAGANATGRSVDKLVDSVKGRLGGIAQKQMASMTVQTLKQKEAFDSLFGALDIEGWLTGWKSVRDLMTQATASGRALKFMITTLLQPLINSSKEATPIVKILFQEMIIAALKVMLVIGKIRKPFVDAFKDVYKFYSGIIDSETKVKLLKLAMGGLAGVLAALSVAVMVLAVKVGLFLLPVLWGLAAPFLPFILAAAAVGVAIASLMIYWDDLVQAIKDVDLGQMIMDGILFALDPLKLGRAMVSLAGTMIDSFKKAIGAHSPAKAFIKIGSTIPEGVVEGVDAGAPQAADATASMIDAAAPKLGPRGAPTGAPGEGGGVAAAARGGATINIATINVQANSDKPEQLALDFRRELERVLEGFAFELGARESAA